MKQYDSDPWILEYRDEQIVGPIAQGVLMIFGFVAPCYFDHNTGANVGERAGKGDALGRSWLSAASPNGTPVVIAFGATASRRKLLTK